MAIPKVLTDEEMSMFQTGKNIVLNNELPSEETTQEFVKKKETIPKVLTDKDLLREDISTDETQTAKKNISQQILEAGDNLGKGVLSFFAELPTVAGGLVKEFAEKLESSRETLEQAKEAGDIKEILTNPLDPRTPLSLLMGEAARRTRIDESINNLTDKILKANKKFLEKTELGKIEGEGIVQEFAYGLGKGLSSFIVAGGVTALSGGNPIVGSALFGAHQKGSSYLEARRAGKSIEEASLISTAKGVAEGGLEFIGLDIVFNRIGKKGGAALLKASKRALTEAVQESSQTVADIAIDKLTNIRNPTRDEIIREIGLSATIGAFIGSGASPAIDIARQTGTIEKAKEAGLTERQIERGIELATDNVNSELSKFKPTEKELEPYITQLNTQQTKDVAKPLNTEISKELLDENKDLNLSPPEDSLQKIDQKIEQLNKEKKPIPDSLFKRRDAAISVLGISKQPPTRRSPSVNKLLGKIDNEFIKLKRKTIFKEKIKSLTKGAKIGAKEAKIEIKQVQNTLIDTLNKSDLELKDKAKFIKTIRNTQTVEQLNKTIPDINKRIESLENKSIVRGLKNQIIKELKTTRIQTISGKPQGKFTPQTQELLNVARNAVKLTKDQSRQKIEQNLRIMGNEVPDIKLALENKILETMGGLEESTPEDLKSILVDIILTKETGKTISELSEFVDTRRINEIKARTLDIITGGKGIPSEVLTTGKINPKASIFQNTKDFINANLGWKDILDILSSKDKSSRPFQSDLSKFGDVLTEKTFEKRGERTNIEIIRTIGKNIFGLKNDRQLVNKFILDSKEENLGTFKNKFDEKIEFKMTRAETRKRYMELQDKSLTETFDDTMGYTDQMKKAITDFLTPQDIQFAEAQLDFYRSYYEGINEVYSKIYGVNLPQLENYSPIERQGITKTEVPAFGDFLQEISLRSTTAPGSLKTRTGNKITLKLNSDISALEKHIAEMEHFKAWAQKIRDLRRVFSDGNIRQAIKINYGSNMVGLVDGFLNDFTRGGLELSRNLSWLDKLRGNFTRAILAIKPKFLAKQLVSFIAYADSIPIKNFVSGTIDFWESPIRNSRILNESELLKGRGQTLDRDIRTAMKSDEFSSFRKRPNFLNSLLLNVKLGDKGAILMGGWPVYKFHLDQGLSKAEALRKFENITQSTQQSSDLDELSAIQRGGSFAKLFTMFKSSPNQYFRKEYAAIRNLINKRATPKEVAKTITIYHILIPLLFQMVSDLGLEPKNLLRASVLGPLNGLFIIGDMLTALVNRLLGNRAFDVEVPIMGVKDEALKGITLLRQLVDADDITTEDIIKGVRGILGASGSSIGIPLKPPFDILMGTRDVLKGDYASGFAQVLGWSPFIFTDRDRGKTRNITRFKL